MGYLNPIMQFGFENFCRRCVECGIDGVIIPDLPFRDYQEQYRIIAERYGIKVIMLITRRPAKNACGKSMLIRMVLSIWFHQRQPPEHNRISMSRSGPISKNREYAPQQSANGRVRNLQ